MISHKILELNYIKLITVELPFRILIIKNTKRKIRKTVIASNKPNYITVYY